MSESVRARLKERFAQAGVPLRIAVRPLVRRGPVRAHSSVMIMDIRPIASPVPPHETVILWPGEARIEVPAIDARHRQLVLEVEERERVLLIKHRRFPNRWDPMPVPADRRSLLVGMDECHLFMARLPRPAASVANAHDLLAPPPVSACLRHGTGVPRQGEHFFVPATAEQLAAIRELLRRGFVPRPHAVWPQRDGRWVSRPGKPHWAEESFFIGPQFVRGVIRHPDHRPLRLREWARPEVNAEVLAYPLQGVTWID